MTDTPPPIPNPPVHPGALRAPEIDYAALEMRVLAQMAQGELLPWQKDILKALISNKDVQVTAKEQPQPIVVGIDPASLAGDHTAMTVALAGHAAQIVIIDECHLVNDLHRRDITEFDIERGERTITGRLTARLDETLFAAFGGELPAKKAETGEFRPDNRKQRRIDAAKERRKPRGQRKRVIMDIETYDPNRTKDWK